jgi:hypothetical protein
MKNIDREKKSTIHDDDDDDDRKAGDKMTCNTIDKSQDIHRKHRLKYTVCIITILCEENRE